MWFIEVAFVSERGESGEPCGSTEVTEGVFKASCVRRVQTHEKTQNIEPERNVEEQIGEQENMLCSWFVHAELPYYQAFSWPGRTYEGVVNSQDDHVLS